jgi:hypothetical protein
VAGLSLCHCAVAAQRATERALLQKQDGSNLQHQLLGVTATKGMCDRLVAAAFKTVENSAVRGQQRPEMIKLECYTYMSLCLSRQWTEGSTGAIFGEAHNLATRGRQHATAAYATRAIRTYFGAVVDASRAPAADVPSQLHAAMRLRGGGRNVVQAMRRDLLEALCAGAKAAQVDADIWKSCAADVWHCLDSSVERLGRRAGLELEAAALRAYRDDVNCLL